MNLTKQIAIVLLIASALHAAAHRSLALDDWGESVDIAVCHQGAAYKEAAARVQKLVGSHQLNGIILEFHHSRDGRLETASNSDKPEGFLVLVQDETVRAARKLLRAEITAGLQVTLLYRSLFFPERNTREFIRKNGSWDSPDWEWRQRRDASFRKTSEEIYKAR